MAQGQLKNKKTCHVKEQKSKRVSRGIRISSKNKLIQTQKKMEKKLSAKNIQNIELQMSMKAASTGKLTIMKSVADKAIQEKENKNAAASKKKNA